MLAVRSIQHSSDRQIEYPADGARRGNGPVDRGADDEDVAAGHDCPRGPAAIMAAGAARDEPEQLIVWKLSEK
jgi:hypothetical protein